MRLPLLVGKESFLNALLVRWYSHESLIEILASSPLVGHSLTLLTSRAKTATARTTSHRPARAMRADEIRKYLSLSERRFFFLEKRFHKGLDTSLQPVIHAPFPQADPRSGNSNVFSAPPIQHQPQSAECPAFVERLHHTVDPERGLDTLSARCGRGGIGRRARFRFLCPIRTWRFDSSRPHFGNQLVSRRYVKNASR